MMTAYQAEQLSLDRFWGSAKSAELTTHAEGGATFVLRWADGATVHQFHDTREGAVAQLNGLGFFPSIPLKLAA